MKEFLNLIEHHLQKRKVTRQDLLTKAHINMRTWSRWQSGSHRPRLTTARRIESTLGLDEKEAAQLEALLQSANGKDDHTKLATLEERIAGLEQRLDRVDKLVSQMARGPRR